MYHFEVTITNSTVIQRMWGKEGTELIQYDDQEQTVRDRVRFFRGRTPRNKDLKNRGSRNFRTDEK